MKGSKQIGDVPPPVAVIDIGSTFIRLTIAEKRGERGVRVLERAVQSVAIGRDVVKERRISNTTIEQCVSILYSFAVLLKEYGIPPEAVQAVANAAVRQADNRDAFLDRLSIASRIPFRMIDPGQIGYYYHLALRVIRNKQSGWEKGNVAVTEIGGLTCSLLFRKEGEIRFAQTYGIGSLRLLQQMEKAGLGPAQLEELAEGRTREVAIHLRQNIGADEPIRLLFMGREMRYAAARLHANEKVSSTATIITRLSVSALERLVGQVLRESVEEEVRLWQISYPDAELLAPSLCMAISIARALQLKDVYVSNLSFSDGLLVEAVDGLVWTTTMKRHVLRIAKETGTKYRYDARHAAKVSEAALALFDLLQAEHGCTDRHRLLLEIACLLHDIGVFVNARGHHKHALYLIRNTEFTGLSLSEINLIALIARYHRKATPQMNHPDYAALTHEDRLIVCKLAALLRVADALDRVHDQSLGKLRFELAPEAVLCIPERRVETSAEQVALVEKGDLFEQIFGRRCLIRTTH